MSSAAAAGGGGGGMTSSEVGISPVLLQAITHTLSTRANSGGAASKAAPATNAYIHPNTSHGVIIQDSQGKPQFIKVENQHPKPLLTVVSETPAHNADNCVTHVSFAGAGDLEEQVVYMHGGLEETVIETTVVDDNGDHWTPPSQDSSSTGGENDTISQDSSSMVSIAAMSPLVSRHNGNINMSGMLTAIASHYKNQTAAARQTASNGHRGGGNVIKREDHRGVYGGELIVTEAVENVVATETVLDSTTSSDDSYSSGLPPSAKRPKQELLLQDTTNTKQQQQQQAVATQTLVIQKVGENLYVDANTGQPIEIQGLGTHMGLAEIGNTFVLKTVDVSVSDGGSEAGGGDHKPCPVCGDKVSGYHYGIFSCESCKGFFKRTVQNKKAFICHRKGECDVNLGNRKKCPACRFKRCLVAGMKLEAIREDRQRGGRSSYEGCSPHGRPVTGAMKPATPRTPRTHAHNRPLPGALGSGGLIRTVTEQVIVGGVKSPALSAPRTPALLEDLMSIETLMSEEEGEQPCCAGKLQPGDADVFASTLHLADHCLYKIVRWARNLPDFANVSTDDQILLLQNCWGELLCICCCWHSMHAPSNAIKLCYGRYLTIEQAYSVAVGDVTQRLVDFAAQLKRLEVDLHEFVALKVLLLLTPDVKNLNDSRLIRVQQEKVQDALMIYTTTHYPNQPNKFAELLARLTELSRTCNMGKELLRQRQAQGEVPQYSLLSELLKGDIVVQSG